MRSREATSDSAFPGILDVRSCQKFFEPRAVMRFGRSSAAAAVANLLLALAHSLSDPKADNSAYYKTMCNGEDKLQYLQDTKCAKVFPSNPARDLFCEASVFRAKEELPTGFTLDGPFAEIRPDALDHIVKNRSVDACVILTRRVGGSRGQLFNKYFCTQPRGAYQTWSSSKIFAIANAASTLRGRQKGSCVGEIGLDGSVSGNVTKTTQLGDLATIVTSYDPTFANYSYDSNALASYFHDIGGRTALRDLVQSRWLAGNDTVSLGGNYGAQSPADLGFRLTKPKYYTGTKADCNADPKPRNVDPGIINGSQARYENNLTALAQAELTRRLALHSSVAKDLRFPFLEPVDVMNILQGTEVKDATTPLFATQAMGGMSADPSIFLQSWLNMSLVETAGQGKWRIYSKYGNGYSDSRGVGEVVNNVYACLPGYLGGVEMTIHLRASVVNDESLLMAEALVLEAMGQIVDAVRDGRLVKSAGAQLLSTCCTSVPKDR